MLQMSEWANQDESNSSGRELLCCQGARRRLPTPFPTHLSDPPDSGTDILGDSPRPLQQYRDYLEELSKREPTRAYNRQRRACLPGRSEAPCRFTTGPASMRACSMLSIKAGSRLSCALNTGGLPPEYFALVEQATRHTLLDFLTDYPCLLDTSSRSGRPLTGLPWLPSRPALAWSGGPKVGSTSARPTGSPSETNTARSSPSSRSYRLGTRRAIMSFVPSSRRPRT